MDSVGVDGWVFQVETGGQQRSLEHEHDQVLDGFVVLVGFDSLQKSDNNFVVWVDFQLFLGGHVAHGAGILQGLRFHDPLHVSGPTVLGGDDAAWRFDESVGNGDFFDLGVQDFFHDLAQWLEPSFLFLELFLHVLVFWELEAFFGDAHQVLSVVLFQLLGAVLINWLGHVKDFESSAGQSFNEGRVFNGVLGFTSDIVDIVLVVLHPGNVVFQANVLVLGRRRVVSEELGELLPLVGVFVDSEFDVLTELLVEFVEAFFVFADFVEEFDGFFDQVLSDDLQDLVLLEGFSRNVQWQIFRVHDTFQEVQPFWHEFVAVVHDEHSSNVEFDGVLGFFCFRTYRMELAWG